MEKVVWIGHASTRHIQEAIDHHTAVIEVSALSEYGIRVEIERASSRAPITGVLLAWWRKQGDEFRAAMRERDRSKVGRMARLRGQVEMVE